MWDKPITLRQASWLTTALTVGVVGISFQLTDARIDASKALAVSAQAKAETLANKTYATCLERKVNVERANRNWNKVVLKEQTSPVETYTVPTCDKP